MPLVAFCLRHFLAAFIICTCEFDFRQAQGLLLAVFLGMEARRYRYFNVWRARARRLEMNFYAPMFTGETRDDGWQAVLARDYTAPRHHILSALPGDGCVATTSGFSPSR